LPFKGFSQHTQNFTHVIAIEIEIGVDLRKRLARQMQIQQIVITERHQSAETL